MKNKFLPIFLIIIFLFVFYVFYKGLTNPNIYEPKFKSGKSIPVFEAKSLNDNININSKELFAEDKFYLLNILYTVVLRLNCPTVLSSP